MNVRTCVLLLGALVAGPARAELGNVPGVCQNCDGSTTNDSGSRRNDSDYSTPSQPAETLEERKSRLGWEAQGQWDARSSARRAEWRAQREPTQRLVREADRLRSRGAVVTVTGKNSRIFRTTSGVGGALKGKERDEDRRVLTTAWARLDCATKIAASVFETFDKSPDEAIYLADEAQSALSGATKGIACAPGAPPAGYGVPVKASPAELQKKMKLAVDAIKSYEASKESSATLGLVAEQHKAAAKSAARAAAEAKAEAQQAKGKGLGEEETRITAIAREQAEFQKREEERYKKIFEEQKKNEEAMAAALAALKSANVFHSKGKRP